MLYKAIPRFPYLIKPEQFEVVFFLVYFDEQGFAIGSKNGKRTGDRAFLVGDEVYLAPDEPEKRLGKQWLFLGFYNEQLQAICPAQHKESCYSTVNMANDWAGIKFFHTSPAPEFAYNDEREAKLKRVWYGREETAFGRHTDTIAPLLYQVPNDVALKNEANDLTRAQRRKNRAKPFCLLDCKGGANQIKFNVKMTP